MPTPTEVPLSAWLDQFDPATGSGVFWLTLIGGVVLAIIVGALALAWRRLVNRVATAWPGRLIRAESLVGFAVGLLVVLLSTHGFSAQQAAHTM